MTVLQLPRIVVVGAGYAGLSTALRLARRADGRARVELVDGRAEHQLITRLHEVAAGRLAPAAAAVPLRAVLGGTSVRLRQAWVEGIDLQRGRVTTSAGQIEYDSLVLAPGSQTDYRSVPGAAQLGLPLRTLEDALHLRETLRRRVERATGFGGSERQSGWTFLIAGGGYTGVELAAELASWLPALAHRRGLGADAVRIGLLEAASRLLPGRGRWLAHRAAEVLHGLGVRVLLGTPVRAVDADGVQIDGGRIDARTVIWATGVRAPGWLAEAGLQVGHTGGALVDARLAAIEHPEVLVLGDATDAGAPSAVELAGSAQVAVQHAALAADNLAAGLRGRSPERFVPRILGEALSLGPYRGLARVGGLPLEGAPAVVVKRLSQARYLDQLGGPALGLLQCARQHCWEWQPEAARSHMVASGDAPWPVNPAVVA